MSIKQIKIPATVLDVYCESIACNYLAEAASSRSWFPSLKAIMYGAKAKKLQLLADRAMAATHADFAAHRDWSIDVSKGVATREEAQAEAKPKKARKPKTLPLPGAINDVTGSGGQAAAAAKAQGVLPGLGTPTK